jgi:7-keto-8-aminopelargonate synthetase-like enzyme
VMGAHGRGLLEHCGVESRVSYHMGTLSKALGTTGAYVVGSTGFVQYLVNTARSFIYTTALPPASAAASRAALDVLHAEPDRRHRLWENRHYFAAGLKAVGFRMTESCTPIMPILTGNPEMALALANRLFLQGVYAPAIRPPTVPRETSRVRTTVTSEHTRDQLDAVLDAFRTVGRELRLI